MNASIDVVIYYSNTCDVIAVFKLLQYFKVSI